MEGPRHILPKRPACIRQRHAAVGAIFPMPYSGQTSDLWAGERDAVAVTDEAIEKIKSMIVSGTLRAGDRLPREADLAAELGLSRSSLREAVRALSLVNILDVRRGDGTPAWHVPGK
jgi:Bacterial regulatory proteins, gntR family